MAHDRNDPNQFYHVDFYDAEGTLVHNDIVSTFHELCFLSQGRTFIIREPATATEYLDNLREQAA